MDYNLYYKNQANNIDPSVFRGSTFQRGYGFGDVFKKFFNWIVPIIKKNATPVLQDVGRQIVKTTSDIAYDGLSGQNLKNSAVKRIDDTMNYFSKQYGEGYKKRKYKNKKNKKQKRLKKKEKKKRSAKRKVDKEKKKKEKRRILDIFSQK
jgi:hypothetical protein